ncbi:MAG TPA: hypothetical protein VF713_05330, partial [Thermoanaerobaculia bacterium]
QWIPYIELGRVAALDKVGGLALLARGDARAASPRALDVLAGESAGRLSGTSRREMGLARALSHGRTSFDRRACRLAEAARTNLITFRPGLVSGIRVGWRWR